jgi:hypothetical protein
VRAELMEKLAYTRSSSRIAARYRWAAA